MQTQIRLAPEALNWAAGVGPRTKVAVVRIPLMHQSSSLAPIPSYPEEQLLNDKRRKNLRVMSISITVRDLKKKKRKKLILLPTFVKRRFRRGKNQGSRSLHHRRVTARWLRKCCRGAWVSPERIKQLLRSGRTFSTSPCFLSKCIVR